MYENNAVGDRGKGGQHRVYAMRAFGVNISHVFVFSCSFEFDDTSKQASAGVRRNFSYTDVPHGQDSQWLTIHS